MTEAGKHSIAYNMKQEMLPRIALLQDSFVEHIQKTSDKWTAIFLLSSLPG